MLLRPDGGIKNTSKVLVLEEKARTARHLPTCVQDVFKRSLLDVKVTVLYVKQMCLPSTS